MLELLTKAVEYSDSSCDPGDCFPCIPTDPDTPSCDPDYDDGCNPHCTPYNCMPIGGDEI